MSTRAGFQRGDGRGGLRRQVGRLYTALILHRRFVNVVGDSTAWVAALVLGLLFRYDFNVPGAAVRGVLVLVPLAVTVQFLVGLADGLYVGRWILGSFEEVAALTRTVFVTGAFLAVLDVPARLVPLSVALAAPVLALVAMAGARYAWRLQRERQRGPSQTAQPLLVYGAGEAAAQVISSLVRQPESPFRPVGLIDDDLRKQNLRLRGVPVLGTGAALAPVVERTGAKALLLAIPSADAALVRELSAFCLHHHLDFQVLPSTAELLGCRVGVDDIRRVTEADLLGRREITTDCASIASYLTGKRVLVTGAGGSIGSELCRQLKPLGPERLLMLDRDESALHAVQLSIEGRALLDGDLVLCDIRDENRLREVFDEHWPHVVFHAAALKHLSLLERFPSEAVSTNVHGTERLLELSVEYGVERFVNISSDKAADPISVLGASKRITERLTADAAERASGEYLSVRFGNVLGSRGSILPLFRAQIEAGGPLTVTHPDVTRFFMTVEEAVQLVIQAGALGRDGGVLVLDMGEPVEIVEVARRLIAESGRSIPIEYTGLRPGEKLHETLVGPDETVSARCHPLISHVPVPPLGPARVTALGPTMGHDELIAALHRVASSPTSVQTDGRVGSVRRLAAVTDDHQAAPGRAYGGRP
jgi:FlaA1/EpsC-like NDP-sugar epimerase